MRFSKKTFESTSTSVHNGKQVVGVISTGSTPHTTEVSSVAHVAPQHDSSPSSTPDPTDPVIGQPIPSLPVSQRGRYSHIYEAALAHRGQWLPVAFDTPARARSFANTAIQMRIAMNKPDAVGPIGLERLDAKVRQQTVYLRVPSHRPVVCR